MGGCLNKEIDSGLQLVYAKEKKGQMLHWNMPGYISGVYNALTIAQEQRGEPVLTSEVMFALKKTSYLPSKNLLLVRNALFDLYSDDKILANKEMTKFSIDPKDQNTPDRETEYELYSDHLERTQPTLIVNKQECLKLHPGPNTPTVNLSQLRELLLSKDLARNSELDWVGGGNFRFLDGSNIDGWLTTFSSFPRSGNTMLRRWFEQLTGVISGSDNDMYCILDLQNMGMIGENHIGHKEHLVWITKAHYPIKITRNEPMFMGNKQFCLVRNPMDAIPSYINMFATGTHSLAPKVPSCKTHPEDWDYLVKRVVDIYKFYCENEADRLSNALPTYFVRYEDLCVRPKETLKELFCFLLNVKDVEGTVIAHRIDNLVDSGSASSSSVYKLKQGQDYSKLLRNESKYTEAQKENMLKELRQALLFFGYTKDPSGKNDTDTSFFNLENCSAEEKDKYLGFKKKNEEVMKKVGTPEFIDPTKTYEFNDNNYVKCAGLPIINSNLAAEMTMR